MAQQQRGRSERAADGQASAETVGDEPSMTINEFCSSQRISRAFFYVMRKEGWGPRLMHVGGTVRISPEARRDWRREREAAAAAGIRRGKHCNEGMRGLPGRRIGEEG
jgi:hypothetical protein